MANKSIGILLGDDGDLNIQVERDFEGKIIKGLRVGDVTGQNQKTILISEPGDIKENPVQGVGVASYLDDDDVSDLFRSIRINLRNDGQNVRRCGFNENGKIIIVGGYDS
ncbi:hypothetical protein [Dysgonomonas sp. 520]|uniref:hypothetical protein n=1 Tax=Dysgonomonas sp. 520 TaxID=2302931 RepID=UPI0013D6EFF5|nr:hypothetical protein [Dysgonomonas sp. 520]NDW10445.1 hypothetical protein [Dysgonomonas sp. 520]